MDWSALTHNGTVTTISRKTGEHRTFRIRRQRDDSAFMPGERLVSLLVGPNNSTDFRNFGVVNPKGFIAIWQKHQKDPLFQWAARFLVDPSTWSDRVTLEIEGRCRICNRKLTTPESIRSGIGPICEGRL